MARQLIGAALLPSAVFMALAAARSVAGLTTHGQAAWPFLAGLGLTALFWWFGRYTVESVETAAFPIRWAAALTRRGYVFGHELTHALAAWSVGAKVLGFAAGEDSGHIDLSRTNAFVALAPYCVPIYTLVVVAGYRVLLWLRPGAQAHALFLALIGVSIGFHLLKTFETIWDARQPDLPAAGGVVFSVSWIVMVNALTVLLLAKALFPAAVELAGSARGVWARTAAFWSGLYGVIEPLRRSFLAQLKRP